MLPVSATWATVMRNTEIEIVSVITPERNHTGRPESSEKDVSPDRSSALIRRRSRMFPCTIAIVVIMVRAFQNP